MPSTRYWCHACNAGVLVRNDAPELLCPVCTSDFLEHLGPDGRTPLDEDPPMRSRQRSPPPRASRSSERGTPVVSPAAGAGDSPHSSLNDNVPAFLRPFVQAVTSMASTVAGGTTPHAARFDYPGQQSGTSSTDTDRGRIPSPLEFWEEHVRSSRRGRSRSRSPSRRAESPAVDFGFMNRPFSSQERPQQSSPSLSPTGQPGGNGPQGLSGWGDLVSGFFGILPIPNAYQAPSSEGLRNNPTAAGATPQSGPPPPPFTEQFSTRLPGGGTAFAFTLGPDTGGPPDAESMHRLLSSIMSFVTMGGGGGAFSSDYVFTQEQFDDLITQFMNQAGMAPPVAPGAPEAFLQGLPDVEIVEAQVEKAMDCAICQDMFVLSEHVTKVPCDHLFHRECVVPWLKKNPTCPTCRDSVLRNWVPPSSTSSTSGEPSSSAGAHPTSNSSTEQDPSTASMVDDSDGGHDAARARIQESHGTEGGSILESSSRAAVPGSWVPEMEPLD